MRFADRLHVDLRIAPDALEAAVPHLCLQPIVENAIRHGIEASASAGELIISARRTRGRLELVVEDDGPGFRSMRLPVGIGLANTRLRLDELYGDRASLTLANALDGGAIVTMTLPFRECEEPAAPRAEALIRKAAVP